LCCHVGPLKVSDFGAFQISDFPVRDAQPVLPQYFVQNYLKVLTNVYFGEVFLYTLISLLDHEPLEKARVSFGIVSPTPAQCLAHSRYSICAMGAIEYLN
jgi:hypothetical protein